MTQDQRSELNRALAKSIAYKAAGKDKEADHWARAVIELMRDFHLLTDRREF